MTDRELPVDLIEHHARRLHYRHPRLRRTPWENLYPGERRTFLRLAEGDIAAAVGYRSPCPNPCHDEGPTDWAAFATDWLSGDTTAIRSHLPPSMCPTCGGSGFASSPLIDYLVATQPETVIDAMKRAGVLVQEGLLMERPDLSENGIVGTVHTVENIKVWKCPDEPWSTYPPMFRLVVAPNTDPKED